VGGCRGGRLRRATVRVDGGDEGREMGDGNFMSSVGGGTAIQVGGGCCGWRTPGVRARFGRVFGEALRWVF